jgi:hypothetical protein
MSHSGSNNAHIQSKYTLSIIFHLRRKTDSLHKYVLQMMVVLLCIFRACKPGVVFGEAHVHGEAESASASEN